jgi:hypothetical protein
VNIRNRREVTENIPQPIQWDYSLLAQFSPHFSPFFDPIPQLFPTFGFYRFFLVNIRGDFATNFLSSNTKLG